MPVMADSVDLLNSSLILQLLGKLKSHDIENDDIDWLHGDKYSHTPPYHENYNSNSININTDNTLMYIVEYVGNLLYFYYVPVIVLIGSFGNILSVMVFFKSLKLRKLSSSYYLGALAISDTCFLFGLLMQWLNFIDIDVYNRNHFCQFFTYLSNLACFCSSWFVVGFTVERFIAITYPLKHQHVCTTRRAKIVLMTLCMFGVLHCVPFWIVSTPAYSPRLDTIICDIKTDYKVTIMNSDIQYPRMFIPSPTNMLCILELSRIINQCHY